MKKLIEFKNVHISLENEILFEDISFSIYEGERFMLTGKNGSGKSLLLELIALGYTNDLKSRYKGLVVTGHIYDENGQDLLDPKTERSISYVTQTEDFKVVTSTQQVRWGEELVTTVADGKIVSVVQSVEEA